MALRRRIVTAVMAVVLACSLAAQTQERFKGRLSPVPVEAKTRADITGVGSISAVLAGTKLSVTGSFEGLRGPATEAHVHQGPVTGVRGAAVLDLTVTKATSGAISGSFDLTPQQIESLKKGRLYIQIASEKAPDGNLWGWLLP
jgi:hypothetical protein